MDLAELAKKRWIEKWSVSKMANHFERSPETIQMHVCKLRKGKVDSLGICAADMAQIRLALFESFQGKP